MKVSQMTVKCDGCGVTENMIYEKDLHKGKFRLPFGWRYRTRAFSLEENYTPNEIQVVCGVTCAEKMENGGSTDAVPKT